MDPAVDATLRLAYSLLLLVAASHKARDLPRFRATLAEYRLLPAGVVAGAAVAIATAEATLAVLLVVPGLRTPALLATAVLLVVYGGAVGVNLVRGRRDIDCGCAGPAVQRPLSGWLVVRNAGLAAVALTALVPVRARPLVWVDALTAAGATAVLAACHVALDGMMALAPVRARLRGAA